MAKARRRRRRGPLARRLRIPVVLLVLAINATRPVTTAQVSAHASSIYQCELSSRLSVHGWYSSKNEVGWGWPCSGVLQMRRRGTLFEWHVHLFQGVRRSLMDRQLVRRKAAPRPSAHRAVAGRQSAAEGAAHREGRAVGAKNERLGFLAKSAIISRIVI